VAYLNPNSFYSHYRAPRSRAFGGPNLQRKATGTIKPVGSVGLLGPNAPTSSPAVSSQPASGAPAPPQGFTVAPANLPPDAAYQQTIGGLGQALTNTLAGLTQQRGAYLSGAGFTEDPTTHAIAFDPNNPYSQAALLRQNYQQAGRGNTTSYAASGQLYAGSLQNAQNASTDQYNRGDNAIRDAVINFLANNTTAQKAAGDAYDYNAGIALGQSVANAPNNPLYNPQVGTGGGTYSTDANGNTAITAGVGGTALVPQQANSTVKLASGWSVVLDANGNAIRFIAPGG
jgi:hypothetical protein